MKTIQIDGNKLRKLFVENHIAMSAASKECGYSSKYFSNACDAGAVGMAAASLLEIRHGIMLRDYIYVEPPKPVKPEPLPEPLPEPEPEQTELPVEAEVREVEKVYQPVAALDMGELQQAIALAMQNTKAPELDYDALRGAIREGILDALYQALNDSDMRGAITELLSNAHLSALQLNLKKVKEASKR